uniref:Uncharacterized protein n=1 Tax=Alexandrium catenella TaxID=2925 RepID=A0A7S1QC43_ALECA|mmetsp:Transcript_23848/g.64967  ORF Transcript_23848/g.64967 Transcript_23848/m.64967 type:complete len:157 (+) Transcript_23848:1-471(+)
MAPSSPLGCWPEGGAVPLPAARSLLPMSGGMGSAASVKPEAQVVKHHYEFERDKDRDRIHFGAEAYRHPAPMPKNHAGRSKSEGATAKARCDREYAKNYAVCKRYPPRMKLDCEHDCHRKRRTCYWNERPMTKRIREEFHEFLKIGKHRSRSGNYR